MVPDVPFNATSTVRCAVTLLATVPNAATATAVVDNPGG